MHVLAVYGSRGLTQAEGEAEEAQGGVRRWHIQLTQVSGLLLHLSFLRETGMCFMYVYCVGIS